MMFLVALALAAPPPFEPGKDGKKCAKDPEGAQAAAADLAELVELSRSTPVMSTAPEHRDRMARVQAARKGYMCSRQAMLDAALVLLTSTSAKDLDAAAAYAQEAALDALPLAHFAYTNAHDRALVARGLPQDFGTQFGLIGSDPRGCMHPVATDAITDADRAAWSVAPLTELYAAYLKERGHAGQPPNEATLRRLNLMCLSGKF